MVMLPAIAAAPLAGQVSGAAAGAKEKTWKAPRTADGHPDLQGIWTNATITPLERPAALAGKATLTDAEAAVFEKNSAEELAKVDGASVHPLLAAAGSNGTGAYNVIFLDRGSELARVNGAKRTSLIVDPPDGRIPALTPEARQRTAPGGLAASTA
jgi:hypothetical protein